MILVTGATGLVGSEVCRLLEKKAIAFKGLKRHNSDKTICSDINITWVVGDVLDVLAIDDAMKNVDTVIHCAAIVSFDKNMESEMMKANVLGTQNIVNGCLENNVANLIHVSSIAALGRNKEEKVITEKSQWVDTPLNTVYAKSKYLSEMEVWRGKSEGLNISIVNPSVVIAPGDGKRSSSKLLQYVWDEHFFYINKPLNYVDVRDVASAIVKIYDKKIWGQRYILNQGVISYKDLFQKLTEKLNKKMPRWNVTHKYLGFGVLLSQIWSFISNSPNLVSLELIKTMREDFIYPSDKICKDLQFEFTNSEETFEWATTEFLKIKSSK